MANPRIAPGTLNRVRGSVKVPGNAALNISAQHLAREGIEFTLNDNIVEPIAAMAGVVHSPQPYVQATVRIHVLRTNGRGPAYKSQWEQDGLIGDVKVYSDASNFGDFEIENCAITEVDMMSFAGGQPAVTITISGTYYVNDAMWEAV